MRSPLSLLLSQVFTLELELTTCTLASLAGTDHPFFPPLEGQGDRWKSVDENLDAIAGVAGWGDAERARVMGGNAVDLFGLEV